MPSGEHESPLALAKLDPDLIAWLLANVFDVKVPDYHHARTQAADVRMLVPRTYHADGMVLLCDPSDRPVLAAVLEVQRGRDPTKRRTWKLYVAQLEAELGVDAALLVFCPDPAVARWYRRMFDADGLSLSLRPMIFTPGDIPLLADVGLARDNPALVVLSAICHAGQAEVEALFPALAQALRTVGPDRAVLYYDVVMAGLPPAARTQWRAFMPKPAGYQFLSEEMRQWEANAIARGEAQAVLTVLDARGVEVPEPVREQILACTDPTTLETWLRRAATSSTAAEVMA
jgi:hypothetical protein